MNKPLTNIFSHSFKFPIWSILPNLSNSSLLIQTKDQQTLLSLFHIINLPSLALVQSDIKLSGDWLFAPLVFDGDHLLIKLFPDDTNPQIIGLQSFNIKKATEIWKLQNCNYLGYKNGAICSKSDSSEVVIKTLSGTEQTYIGNVHIERSSAVVFESPSFYAEAEEDFVIAKQFIERQVNVTPFAGIEYHESTNLIFLSYYIKEKDGLANYLTVFDRSGCILLHREINALSKGVGRDTFFILANKLIFIENKHAIQIYEF